MLVPEGLGQSYKGSNFIGMKPSKLVLFLTLNASFSKGSLLKISKIVTYFFRKTLRPLANPSIQSRSYLLAGTSILYTTEVSAPLAFASPCSLAICS